jgi:hypothetical protein
MSSIQAPENLVNLSEKQPSEQKPEISLQNLIPIAMVVAGGCESCAERMVERAIREGSPLEDIDKTLRIIAGTQKLSCFASAVGPEIVARMEKPLQAGRRTLENAIHFSPGSSQRA